MSALTDRLIEAHAHAETRGYRTILTVCRNGIDVIVWDGVLHNSTVVTWIDIETAVVNPLPAAIDKCIADVTRRRE